MGAPKSIVKLKIKEGKASVEYTSDVDATQFYIYELTRAALRDVGKYVKKEFQAAFESTFKQHSKAGAKSTGFKVWSGKNTTAPRVQVGLMTKTVKGFYGYFEEFGSSHTPRYGLLQNTVNNSISQIIEIESKYLSALSGEAEALASMVSEDEYEDGYDE